MGRVRPFVEADVPAVAELRRNLFRISRRSPAATEEYLRRIFLLNPWRDEAFNSLVLEESGAVQGFIGVLPRPMTFRGVPIRVVVSTQFMVAPSSRPIGVIQLGRALFAGPQDLTLADAGPDRPRGIWIGLGGDTALPYSLLWERTIRPGRIELARLGDTALARAARAALRPLASVFDRSAVRSAARNALLEGVSTELADGAAIAEAAPAVAGKRALAPVYTASDLTWLLAELGEGRHGDAHVARLVRSGEGRVLGWYVYRGRHGGHGFVFQIGTTEESAGTVLAALVRDAGAAGITTLRGGANPALLSAYQKAGGTVRRTGPWVLAHSRRADILLAIHRGDAWITGLDGERWLSF